MKSATKEVCDSGSSDNEPLSLKKSSLHQTEAKKYADYILQRNESLKRKAENEAVEQLKAEKKQLEERLLAEKKRRHSLEVEHKRGQETLEKERKERARQVETEEKERLEVERRERENALKLRKEKWPRGKRESWLKQKERKNKWRLRKRREKEQTWRRGCNSVIQKKKKPKKSYLRTGILTYLSMWNVKEKNGCMF